MSEKFYLNRGCWNLYSAIVTGGEKLYWFGADEKLVKAAIEKRTNSKVETISTVVSNIEGCFGLAVSYEHVVVFNNEFNRILDLTMDDLK